VSDADCLHDRTHRAASDNSSTFRSRLDENTTCAVFTNQLVREGVIDQRHANQVLLRRLDSLFDREGHFARLAGAETDVPAFVTNHYERREREVLTALNDFGDAIDGDYLIFQVEPLRGNALLGLSHSLFCFTSSLRNLCVLCVSAVIVTSNRRGAEDAEAAQRSTIPVSS